MIGVLILMSSISIATRVLPYFFVSKAKKLKNFDHLSTLLPPTLIILLVVHCLLTEGCGLLELTALAVVVLSQLIWRNVLMSMLLGVGVQQMLSLWI